MEARSCSREKKKNRKPLSKLDLKLPKPPRRGNLSLSLSLSLSNIFIYSNSNLINLLQERLHVHR
ncbi:hypothetical protein RHGRI_021746 [Rhododendron griersonianum]|uniref:Uncharacterized protein n=1 Tax=Rhododendron griersonianum TaxID=479676 RepID=A0AAV6JLC5_9ERIC|nr:hypothetical protein RHGRI_021746 [Rhododendron griersonianum]KAG5542012.1 hypothetical protein RHGRI_021746 [Rhododendron griersonianum]